MRQPGQCHLADGGRLAFGDLGDEADEGEVRLSAARSNRGSVARMSPSPNWLSAPRPRMGWCIRACRLDDFFALLGMGSVVGASWVVGCIAGRLPAGGDRERIDRVTRRAADLGWLPRWSRAAYHFEQKPTILEFPKLIWAFSGRSALLFAALSVMAVISVIRIFVPRLENEDRRPGVALLIALLSTLLMTFAISFAKPLWLPRYLIICLPSLLLFCASSLRGVRWRFLGPSYGAHSRFDGCIGAADN